MANAKISFSLLLLLLGLTCALAFANETQYNPSSAIEQFHDEFLNEDYVKGRALSPETMRAFEEYKKDDKKRQSLKIAASALGGAGLGLALLAPHLYMHREAIGAQPNKAPVDMSETFANLKAAQTAGREQTNLPSFNSAKLRTNAWKGAVGVGSLLAAGALVLGILSSRANEKIMEKRRRFRGTPKFETPDFITPSDFEADDAGWYPRGNLESLTQSQVEKAMADVVERSADYRWPTQGWRRPVTNLERIRDAKAVADAADAAEEVLAATTKED